MNSRIREQREGRRAHAELSALRLRDLALCADPVAQVQVGEGRHALLPQNVDLQHQLDVSGTVPEHAECKLAVPALEHEPPGDRCARAGVGVRLDGVEPIVELARGRRTIERHRVRVDAVRARALDLLEPLTLELVE